MIQTDDEVREGNGKHGKATRALAAVVLSVVVAGLALELGARFLPVEALSLDTLDPMRERRQHRYQPHPYVTFTPRPSWKTPPERKLVATHNSMGFRGKETTWEKPKGRYRIVCLGGSSTYGYTTTSDEATYPVRLEVHLSKARPDLDIEVINCGAPGYTSFESLATLGSRASALDPDLIIVYHGINDAHASLYRSSAHPNAQVMVDNTHYRNNWLVSEKGALELALENSRAFMVLRRYMTDYVKRQTQLNAALVVDNDPGQKNRFDNPNPSEVGFENFERNLISIIGIAQAHGAKVVLATQGTDVEDFAKEPGGSGEAQERACRRNGETVRRVAGGRRVAHLADIAPGLEELAGRRKAQGKDDVFTATVHFTNHGADLMAQMMGKEVVQSGFLPERGRGD